MKPALVILAAGASERLGECKALVDLGGKTALARLVTAGAEMDEVPPLVVCGKHAREIAASAPPDVQVLENEDWARGRTGGIALAARAREGRDLCLAPVDSPLVPRAVFTALTARWLSEGAPSRGWLAPRHAGRYGHPVVVGKDLLGDLLALAPDTPLRALRDGASPLLALDVEDPSVLDDLDTPSDLARLRARIEDV